MLHFSNNWQHFHLCSCISATEGVLHFSAPEGVLHSLASGVLHSSATQGVLHSSATQGVFASWRKIPLSGTFRGTCHKNLPKLIKKSNWRQGSSVNEDRFYARWDWRIEELEIQFKKTNTVKVSDTSWLTCGILKFENLSEQLWILS